VSQGVLSVDHGRGAIFSAVLLKNETHNVVTRRAQLGGR